VKGVQPHPQKFWFGENLRKFLQNMCKPSQNCCTCFDFTKMAPKKIIFFWKSYINLVIFGQLKWNLGKVLWYLGKNGAQTDSIWKQCAQWNAVVFYGCHFFWIFFRASLQKVGLQFFAPPNIFLLLNLCFSYMRFIDETDIDCKLSVTKGSVNVLSTSKMKTTFLLTLDFAGRCRETISRLQ